MDRTTIMLPRDLKVRLTLRARELGISVGELIRRAVSRALDQSPGEAQAADPLMGDESVCRESVPPDYSTRHDDHLYGDDS